MLLCFLRVEDLNCEARLTVAHSFARVCLFADRFALEFQQHSCFHLFCALQFAPLSARRGVHGVHGTNARERDPPCFAAVHIFPALCTSTFNSIIVFRSCLLLDR